MSVPSTPLCIQSVFAGQINKNSLSIPVKIEFEDKIIETLSLLDSGAGGEFIDQNYAKTLKLPLLNLEKSIPAVNVDGTLNKKGTIKQYIDLNMEIFGQKQIIRLLVTGLGKQLWRNGSTIYRAQDTRQSSIWTIRTLLISDQHRSLIDDKLNGRYTSQNLM